MPDDQWAERRMAILKLYGSSHSDFNELRNVLVHWARHSPLLVTTNYDSFMETALRTTFAAASQWVSRPADLEEEFEIKILPKYGDRRARIWFWKQALSTIATRNPVCRWLLVGVLVRIGEWIFRRIGG